MATPSAALRLVDETTEEQAPEVVTTLSEAALEMVMETAASCITSVEAGISQRLLNVLMPTISAAQGSVMLRSGDELEVVAASGHSTSIIGSKMPRGRGVAWCVMESGKDLQVFGVFDRARVNYNEYRSSMVVPITGRHHVLGTLNLNRRLDGFSELEFRWARYVAQLMGRTLEASSAIRENLHPWRSPHECLIEALGNPETEREVSRLVELVSGFAKDLGLAHMAPRLVLAASLAHVASMLLPQARGLDEIAEVDALKLVGVVSAALLRALGVDEDVCEIVKFSGERWDGLGPLHLKGEKIPALSRILAVARAVTAAGDKSALKDVLARLSVRAGADLCPHVLAALWKSLNETTGNRT